MDKINLRKQALESRKTQNVKKVSDYITSNIIKSNILDNYRKIGIYYPLKYEIDLRYLTSYYKNKKFYIPRINENDLLEFALYNENELKKGPFKTYEPTEDKIDINKLECIFIPCVAISNNKRIGYGKGYYDKSLVGYKGIKIGICYSNAIFNYDLDDYDLSFDYVFSGGDMKFSVILLMAGEGSRMKMNKNKVLLPYKNKLIYEVSLDLFRQYSSEIICVTNKKDALNIPNVIQVFGGKTRQESVYNALKVCTNDYVLIHDAARPLLSKDVLEQIINKMNLNTAILTCSKVKDTIKINNDGVLQTLDRSKLLAASTPQCASLSYLLDSHNKAIKDNLEFTDDISMIEKYHSEIKIDLVYQNDENFKVTTPLDYKILTLLGEEND